MKFVSQFLFVLLPFFVTASANHTAILIVGQFRTFYAVTEVLNQVLPESRDVFFVTEFDHKVPFDRLGMARALMDPHVKGIIGHETEHFRLMVRKELLKLRGRQHYDFSVVAIDKQYHDSPWPFGLRMVWSRLALGFQLLLHYSKVNNVKYTHVIRLRPDIVFINPIRWHEMSLVVGPRLALPECHQKYQPQELGYADQLNIYTWEAAVLMANATKWLPGALLDHTGMGEHVMKRVADIAQVKGISCKAFDYFIFRTVDVRSYIEKKEIPFLECTKAVPTNHRPKDGCEPLIYALQACDNIKKNDSYTDSSHSHHPSYIINCQEEYLRNARQNTTNNAVLQRMLNLQHKLSFVESFGEVTVSTVSHMLAYGKEAKRYLTDSFDTELSEWFFY